MNKKHLIMLADYLDALPENYEHFDMKHIYVRKSEGGDWIGPLRAKLLGLECGTVACAMGHTFFVEGMPQPEELDVGWFRYAERIYSLEFDKFSWCFDRAWKVKDNTPRGAAARIRRLVSDGVPDDWYNQIHCPDHPLSYTVHTSPTEKDID